MLPIPTSGDPVCLLSVNDAPVFELSWSDENESFEDGTINLYEDFGTQFVSIFPGLIPVDEMGQTVEYVISPSNINSADISIISSNSEVVIEIVSKLDLYETIEFTVSAIDDGGVDNNGEDQFSQTFVLDIIPVNDQPSFLKGNNQNVLEDSGPIIVSSWASEISKGPSNESNQELEFIVTTSNDNFFKNSIIPTINPFNGDLFFEIADDLNGEVEVSLILKDNGGTDFEGSESKKTLIGIS